MSVKEGFMGANLLMKIAIIVVLVAQLLSWIAFTTSSWRTDNTGSFGLWRSCGYGIGGCSFVDGTNNDDMAATQAFAIFGFVSLNLGCLLLIFSLFWAKCKGNNEVILASGISLIVSAATWLIAVAVFAGTFKHSGNKLGFSFAIAVCALVLSLAAGILVLVSRRGGTSVASK